MASSLLIRAKVATWASSFFFSYDSKEQAVLWDCCMWQGVSCWDFIEQEVAWWGLNSETNSWVSVYSNSFNMAAEQHSSLINYWWITSFNKLLSGFKSSKQWWDLILFSQPGAVFRKRVASLSLARFFYVSYFANHNNVLFNGRSWTITLILPLES